MVLSLTLALTLFGLGSGATFSNVIHTGFNGQLWSFIGTGIFDISAQASMGTFGLSLAQAYLILALPVVPGTGSGTGFFELPGTGFWH